MQDKLDMIPAGPLPGGQGDIAQRRDIDWCAVERDYRAGGMSLREMSAKHGCSHSAIANRAGLNGWKRDSALSAAVVYLKPGARGSIDSACQCCRQGLTPSGKRVPHQNAGRSGSTSPAVSGTREVMTPAPVNPRDGERLLADIGGTNARFGWQNEAAGSIDAIVILPCVEHSTLADAIQHYLTVVRRSAPPNCAIAIANPVLGDRVQMTNHHWSFSIDALKLQFGFAQLCVLNDFTALALALPALPLAELRQVGGGAALPGTQLR